MTQSPTGHERSWQSPNGTEVSFEFRRHVGPKFVHGAVTLSFTEATKFDFRSTAVWPEQDNYEAAVREEIESVLASFSAAGPSTAVCLKAIVWDPIHSSEAGFRRAARAATRAALAV